MQMQRQQQQGIRPNPVAGVRMGDGSMEEFVRRVNAWKRYVFEIAPNKINLWTTTMAPRQPGGGGDAASSIKEFLSSSSAAVFDVIVVGFGGAGAAAALDAADAGKRVLLIDRFDGGGSTRRSGGVYYAGAGTRVQKENGISDDAENMFKYLKKENDGAVSDEAIRMFCEQSPETFAWLEGRIGVPFRQPDTGKSIFYGKKTSYPPSFASLYQSGNESAYPHKTIAKPAPRGHRPTGDYLVGNVLFGAIEKAVENHPLITVRFHASLKSLIMKEGKCIGVTVQALPLGEDWTEVHGMHVMLHEIGSGSPFFDSKDRVIDTECRKLESQLFAKLGVEHQLLLANPESGGVVLATGGFFFNSDMVKKYAPKYHGFMPLGNLGDDGAGLEIARRDANTRLDRMDRCSAWKFINPPYSFVRGVLVNAKGKRVGNEDVYGATFADFLVQQHDGKGWLIIDQKLWEEASTDCMDPESGLQEDQRMQGLANLHRNHKKGDSLKELAQACNFDVDLFVREIEGYSASATKGDDPQFHKAEQYLQPLVEPPFYAINLNMVGNKYWPTPSMTLGGICVDPRSGRAISASDGKPIPGLYAAGRCAVGVASNYYVSGLSIADAIFSGRRAGRHLAKL